jgi:tetratricopeptide (TPR) repeat protein
MASVDADVAALFGSTGKVDDALIRFDSATKRYLLALEAPDKDGDVRFELIRTYLAAAAATLNDKKNAAPLLAQAKEQFLIWKAARSPDDKEIDNMQMFMYRIEYRQALAFDGYEAALKFSDAEIAIIDRYLVREPSNANHLQHKQGALLNSSVDLLDAKRAKEALARIERAIPLGEKLIKVDADNANFSGGNARTFTHCGRIFLALEQPAEAKQAFLKSIELWKFADGRDVLPYMRRQQGEAAFLLAREFFAEKELASARKYGQQFLLFAEKYPDIFTKEPASKWVVEAKLFVQ